MDKWQPVALGTPNSTRCRTKPRFFKAKSGTKPAVKLAIRDAVLRSAELTAASTYYQLHPVAKPFPPCQQFCVEGVTINSLLQILRATILSSQCGL